MSSGSWSNVPFLCSVIPLVKVGAQRHGIDEARKTKDNLNPIIWHCYAANWSLLSDALAMLVNSLEKASSSCLRISPQICRSLNEKPSCVLSEISTMVVAPNWSALFE
jgi:hypothetical protein